jgi:type IV secretory pathway VirJ component
VPSVSPVVESFIHQEQRQCYIRLAMRSCACILLLYALTAAAIAAPADAAPQSASRAASPARTWDERRISLPQIGSSVAYIPQTPTLHVVLLISGDAGWNAPMSAMARRIAPQAVVIGVSYPALKRSAAREGGCWYTASDLELISHAAQKALKLPQYHPPALVGYGAGAAVVYAALAAAPAITFAGGVSLGFCPTLPMRREICSGDTWSPSYDEKRHLNHLPPSRTLPKDWYVMLGVAGTACPADAARRFVAGMPKTHAVEGASFEAALQDLWSEKDVRPPAAVPVTATTRELEADLQRLQLPLEFRWPSQLSSLLVFFSGDGGWASLDEAVAEHVAARGVGVVGVSSLRYFWQAKPPAQVAADLRRLAATLARSGKPVVAGGFSFGAEVVPVALEEWPVADRRLLNGLVLIAPGLSASFEIDPLDWVRAPQENPAARVASAVRDLGLPALCLAGVDETDTPCATLAGAPGVKAVRLPGSHHFNSDYTAVAEAVLDFIRVVTAEKHP